MKKAGAATSEKWNTSGAALPSLFDPVLAERLYRFCPEGGRILDPFAGREVRGLVAGYLFRRYTGIEINSEQVDENLRAFEKQKTLGRTLEMPNWIRGDSGELGRLLLPGDEFDLVFTCPPYYDLEVYSDDPNDLSALPSYEKFMQRYEDIFRQAVARLKRNRFCITVVAEIRDEEVGFCLNFVGDNIALFRKLGLKYSGQLILVHPAGSLPPKVGKFFPNYRKLGQQHENVLIFYKGDDLSLFGT